MKNLKIITALFAAISMIFVASVSQAATYSFGQFRIGLHLQAIDADCIGLSGCGDTDSDSYVNTPNVVPVPAAAWLFGTALLGFFATARRKKIL